LQPKFQIEIAFSALPDWIHCHFTLEAQCFTEAAHLQQVDAHFQGSREWSPPRADPRRIGLGEFAQR